jgi:hypothetical protein
MVKCSFCDQVYPENTLFCDECGAYLTPGNGQATDPLSDLAPCNDRQEHVDEAAHLTLILSIEEGGSIELPLSKEVILGRLDASQAIFPDVDLSEQGLERGISRRHARISRRGSHVFVEDLNSLNGTYLNANRLAPELPYPLHDGDRVQLGNLVLAIHLK